MSDNSNDSGFGTWLSEIFTGGAEEAPQTSSGGIFPGIDIASTFSDPDPFGGYGTGITLDGGKGLTAPEQTYTFPTTGTTVTRETVSDPMIGEAGKETSAMGGLGAVGAAILKNPAMAGAIINAIGSMMNKKKPKALQSTATSAYGNFTADQKKMIDHYLNKNSFDWKLNPRQGTPKFAQGGLAQLTTGGTPPKKPSTYQTKFNASVDKWLNTQAAADRGRITKQQREATRSHLWDMANNTFGDIYGASLDDFGTGTWKGDDAFANPEVLANMQKYVKDPGQLLSSITQKLGGNYSTASVFDPVHNQWVAGGYNDMYANNPKYNSAAARNYWLNEAKKSYGDSWVDTVKDKDAYAGVLANVNANAPEGYYDPAGNWIAAKQWVKDPKSFGWQDVDLEENRKYGQNLNKALFESFYNPAQQQSTFSGDPYAVNRMSAAYNPVYDLAKSRIEKLYGSKDAALKADASLGELYGETPSKFLENSGLYLTPGEMAKRYSEGLYGTSDKTMMSLYDDPMKQFTEKYVKSDPYQKYAKDQFAQYDPYTDMSFDDFISGLASGNQDVTSILTKTPQQLGAERYAQQQNETMNKRLGSGYWSNQEGAYDNIPANLPTSNMGNVGAHRWFVDSTGKSTTAPQEGLAVKNPPPPPPPPPTPSTQAYDPNNITGYTTNAQGQQIPIYGAIQQEPPWVHSAKRGGLARLSGGGNPNEMPIPSGYEQVWYGDPSNPNSYFELRPIAPEQEEAEGGGCYVTSAVMQERGDADDNAPELQLMRQMRDEAYAENPEEYGPKIEEYYRTAPKIVEALESSPEGRVILKEVYARYIRPAAEAMEQGDRQTAEALYHEMLEFVAPYAADLMGDSPEAAEAVSMGAHAAGGSMPGRVDGHGNGQDDKIPALLSKDEYVFDADTVSALGDGSSEAGAKILDEMRENIRAHKRSAPANDIPPPAKSPLEYLKKGA